MQKITLLLGVFFFIAACGTPKMSTKTWLKEYEALLQETAQMGDDAPTEFIYDIYERLSEKEAEIDVMVEGLSVQEKSEFLSDFYDLKLQYINNPQQ
ncbi:MAG: hypothetical protein ACRCS8_06455 [Brevinema sp.]